MRFVWLYAYESDFQLRDDIMNTKLAHEKVLILGAHTDPSRYAYRAAHMLTQAGHTIVPVGRRKGKVAGTEIQVDTAGVAEGEIDTVTLYINPTIQENYKEEVSRIHPKRVIFNPGTENPEWMRELENEGIEPEVACTLVLLSTGQY